MTRREAKRHACHVAALWLRAADSGADEYPGDLSPADAERVADAFAELVEELERRGWAENDAS